MTATTAGPTVMTDHGLYGATDCPVCDGAGWLEGEGGTSDDCAACEGVGWAADRAAPLDVESFAHEARVSGLLG